jgi:hypothetical protein
MKKQQSFAFYVYVWMAAFGFDPIKTFRAIKSIPHYVLTYIKLRSQSSKEDENWPVAPSYPQLHDRAEVSGTMSGHYFHQDLHVAQLIYRQSPAIHLDVGSRIDGFVAHLATFREVQVLDIRPNLSKVRNIHFIQADIMNPPEELAGKYVSLSCLHALEHFGLGRYGDEIALDGFQRGLNGMHSLLKTGGRLYLSTPVGAQRIEFNAHRVFDCNFLRNRLQRQYKLLSFAFVDDDGNLHTDIAPDDKRVSVARYGCGIFELEKMCPLGECRQ